MQRYDSGIECKRLPLTELEHIVHLNIVPLAWKGFRRPLRTISIVVTIRQIRLVLDLLLGGKGEEFLADRKLAVYFFLRQSEDRDVEETDVVDSILQLGGQLLLATWGIELRQVQCDQIGPFDCARLDFHSVLWLPKFYQTHDHI